MPVHLDTETLTRQPARQCHCSGGGQRTHDTASRNVNHVRSACGGEEREMIQAATDCDSMASEGGLYYLAPRCGGVAHF